MKPTLCARTLLKDRVRSIARTAAVVAVALVCTSHLFAGAQEGVAEKMERLDSAILRVQTQLEESQRELRELQQQLSSLRLQAGLPMRGSSAPSAAPGRCPTGRGGRGTAGEARRAGVPTRCAGANKG